MDIRPADRLLGAWLSLTSTLWNTRIVSSMTFNECHILGLLLRREDAATATDLIAQTHLLKSQMNKILTALESKGFILRERAQHDKRMVYIRLTPEGEAAYVQEHAHVEALLAALIERIGADRACAVADELSSITLALDELLSAQS